MLSKQKAYNAVKRAFASLRKQNVIARMNHKCCMSCALADLGPRVDEEKKDGVAYFHGQDYQGYYEKLDGCDFRRARERKHEPRHALPIRYASAEETDKAMVEFGHRVVAALKAEGLDTDWDGDPGKVIYIYGDLTDSEKADYAYWKNRMNKLTA